MVVVVVADSTGCNGSASRLTRRTRLHLSTYRKHREREEDKRRPRFSSSLLLIFFFLSFAFFFPCVFRYAFFFSRLAFSFFHRYFLGRFFFLSAVFGLRYFPCTVSLRLPSARGPRRERERERGERGREREIERMGSVKRV